MNQQAAGTVPLYVLTIKLNFLSQDGIGDVFLFTTHDDERTNLINSPYVDHMLGGYLGAPGGKWLPDAGTGLAGYIAATQLPGTVPLYRLYHPPIFGPVESHGDALDKVVTPSLYNYRWCLFNSYDTLLTASEKEKASALKFHGYQFVETLGYVWPSAMAVSMQPPPPPKKTTPIDTSGKPVNVDTLLLKAGCLRTGVGEYGCANLGAFNACKTYMKDGRAKGCTYTADAAAKAGQKEMDDKLFSLGCTHFLGRSDEFICKTPTSFNACEQYRKGGKAKRCLMAK